MLKVEECLSMAEEVDLDKIQHLRWEEAIERTSRKMETLH